MKLILHQERFGTVAQFHKTVVILLSFYLLSICICAHALPKGFVYLKNIDPSIIQEIRYAGYHNFVGRPIDGYNAAECILTKPAALALKKVQKALKQQHLTLKVYDCYRPQRAVSDFLQWSKNNSQTMKREFYPRVAKENFFKLGYVVEKSGHSRGSTVDITIVPLPIPYQPTYHRSEKLKHCYAPITSRFPDNSIDMGTGYDCMDTLSHTDNKNIDKAAKKNREFLKRIVTKYGFVNYPLEWWHFTLKNEPYKNTYFDFVVEKQKARILMSSFLARVL